MWETGSRSPEAYVSEILKAFDRSLLYFSGPTLNVVEAELVSFRSRKSLTSRVREQTLARTRFATGAIHPFLERKVKLPNVDLPDLSGHEPEQAAEQLRALWGMGDMPIAHVVHLLEARGVQVYWLNVDSESVDAVSMTIQATPFMFLNLKKAAGERGRFDACHELGHLVLHGGNRSNEFDDSTLEAEADQFASAFLMPKRLLARHGVNSSHVESLLPLKRLLGVSLQAVARRQRDLGIMTQIQYVSFQKELSRRGQIKSEPHQLNREHSSLHPQISERLWKEGISPDDFCRAVALDARDVLELMPVFSPVLSTSAHLRSVLEVENGGSPYRIYQ
jgi:Zn-dependent peptidase ImmA (M78 family)